MSFPVKRSQKFPRNLPIRINLAYPFIIFFNFESKLPAFQIFCDPMKYNTLMFDWVEHPPGTGKIVQKEYMKTENKPKELRFPIYIESISEIGREPPLS